MSTGSTGVTGAGSVTGSITAAEHAERAANRFEKARRTIERSFEASAATFGVIGGIALAGAYLEHRISAVAVALVAVIGAVFLLLCVRMIRAGLSGGAPVKDIVAAGVLGSCLAWLIVVNPVWFMVAPIWVSAAAVCLPRPRQIALLSLGAAVLSATAATVARDEPAHWYTWPVTFGLLFGACVLAAGGNLLQKWMWDLFHDAYTAREAQAVLAVTEERLRFARDLHDLLGHNLALIAVKSELAIRMTEHDPARAVAEMADVRQAARTALSEVRAAVHGYRAVELDAELASVRTVLEAAGVRCEVDASSAADPESTPPEVRAVLAWVVREGATNVLKHSEARRCRISVMVHDGSVILEMVNDGVRAHETDETVAAPGSAPGTGLTGLAERAAVVRGNVTAAPDGHGGFVLRAAIPLPEEAPSSPAPPHRPLEHQVAPVPVAAPAPIAAPAPGSGG